jgi:hypothetical protein
MKIEIDKKYTSNGEPIRILCNDRNSIHYAVIGLRDDGYLLYFKENGESSAGPNYNLVESWEPQPYEWCLFTDTTFYGAMLLQYLSTTITGRFHAKGAGISFDGCTKFTGELPEHLKDL